MHRPTRLKMTDLSSHLTCVLCDGYFVDATTIVECLHSFCRACIVKYLETNKFCPVCDVQVHKTKPLLSIRSDKTLQDVVYKLVPGLYQNEMKRRREFYAEHPEEAARCTSEERGEGANQRFIYTPEETISLSLEYGSGKKKNEINGVDSSPEIEVEETIPPKRYLQCPAAITVGHLKKFVLVKFALPPTYAVEITYSGDTLNEDYTLMDIAYIYAWRRSGPMRFFYRINTHPVKRRKVYHPPPEVKPSVPTIIEPEPPKKTSPEVPTLRLLPSPSSVPHEFKFVLKTIGAKREEKSPESPAVQSQKPAACREKNPIASPAASPVLPQSSSSSNTLEVPPPKLTISLATSHLSQTSSGSKESVATSVAVTSQATSALTSLPSNLPPPENRKPVSTVPTAVSNHNLVQPVVCSSYCPPVVTKPSPGSKRATRSRMKNRSAQRPLLARLAPYPPPRTTSPSTSALATQVNHFASSPVTCFTAPPTTCLSTAPVNCLGTVAVSYLPTAPVTCFGASTVNGAPSLNVNNLVSPAVNNVSMTAGLPHMSVVNSSVQSSVATTPVTSVVQTSCPQSSSSTLSAPVSTLSSNNLVTVPVISSPCLPVTSICSAGTGHVLEPGLTSTANAQQTATCTPVVPKMIFSKSTRDSKSSKSLSSEESRQPSIISPASDSFSCNLSDAPTPTTSAVVSVCSNSSVSSRVVPALSMPVIPVDVSSTQNSISSISLPVTDSIASSKSSPSVSFSVNSLLPNINTQKSSVSSVNSTLPLPITLKEQSDFVQISNSPSLPSKDAGTPKSSGKEQDSEHLVDKHNLQANCIESMTTSTVSAEKNSINVPFKEVKSSITAEFSDNDDLGCQPDLVVDEQKMDSSDNEDDETESALRRKINAIAAKEDEVDVDTETDSGRASDISNQARSSCDDDIGSPLSAVRTSDPERTLPPSPTVSTLASVFVTTAPSTLPASIPTKIEVPPPPAKPNGIDHIISNLHRNHERKDNIGALDLSTSCRKPGEDVNPRPRPRPVANPPVLDAKHRQQTCLPAPTKQHTACVPAPKHPTSSTFHIGPLSASARHSMMAVAAAAAVSSQNHHLNKLPPVTIPHFNPAPLMNTLPIRPPQSGNATHFCRTPPMPIHGSMNPFQGKSSVNYRQGKSNSTHSRSNNNCSSPSSTCFRKSPSASCSTTSPANGRRDSVSPRHSAPSPSTPSAVSPHQRLSPCVTPPKSVTSPTNSTHSHPNNMQPLVPSTTSYKVTRPPMPIYKKSDSYKNSSHHNRFKGSNLTVINPDPNGYRQRIVIKNLDPRPNTHQRL